MERRGMQAAVVVLTVLVVTATFAPVTALQQDERTGLTSTERGTLAEADARATQLQLVAGKTPKAQKRAAVATVAGLDTSSPKQQRAQERARRLVNGTLADYRDETRVTTATVFENDSQAVQALTRFERSDESTRSRVETATRLVVQADNRTAATAITDAERVLNRSRDRVDEDGRIRSAEANLANAERAYERGQAALDGIREKPFAERVRARARAIEQFHVAWQQSRTAIEELDRATSPRVVIQSRADFPRNGTNMTTRRIVGDVVDPQAYKLDNATIRVNSGSARNVSLDVPTAPGTNATFDTNVSFTQRNTTVNVTVVDVDVRTDDDSEHEADEGKEDDREEDEDDGERGPPDDEEDEVEDDDGAGNDRQVDTDILRLDGDGLPDQYETRVVETDPLDPDSGSGRTDADEANDRVVDGLEDFDNDTAITYEEYVAGTDPFAADTDGDRLADRVELTFSRFDPLEADSDGDGVVDGESDPDNDTLTASEEVAFGSNPFDADTDRDRLNDDRERDTGTNPLVSDTDGDGLLDGTEVRLDTDPLVADSDGDGVADGNESFTTQAQNASVETRVSVTGQGDVASGVTIERDDAESFNTSTIANASASPLVRLESARSFDQAEVTIGYDESQAGDESELAVYTFNRTLRTFVKLDSTVDAANNTVTATTSHFSRFVVFNTKRWNAQFTAQTPTDTDGQPSQPGSIPADAIFVLDSSGSMRYTDPQGLRRVGAKRFVGALIDKDRAGVVDFDSYAFVRQELTTDFTAVNASIDRIDSSGGTNIGAGLRAANDEFARASDSSRAKVTVLLSDGFTADEPGARRAAEVAAERNITIYTIGFGNPDDALMQDIATTTGGDYTFVDDVNDLPQVFSRIAENVTQAKDTDGDGIPDARERAGIPTGREGTVFTEFDDADTDNDGLSDGEELGQFVNVSDDGTRITNTDELPDGLAIPEGTTIAQDGYYRLASNPVETDTDSDGLSDFEEVREERPVAYTETAEATDQALKALRNDEQPSFSTDEGVFSDPYFQDSDLDGLDDFEETRQRTNPQKRDTDGDGLIDGDEFALGEDPSLFDTTPPTVEIAAIQATRIADQNDETLDAFDVRYTVRFRVTDPSGVTDVRVFKAGVDGVTFTGDDVPTERLKTTSFVAQSLATFLAETSLGPQVQIRAEDTNGNVKTAAQRGPNAFARAAAVIDDLGGERLLPAELQKLGVIGTLAALSGFTYYISSTVDQVVSGVKFAVDVIRGETELPLSQFAETVGLLLDRPDVLLSVPGAILDSAQRAQRLQNPFPAAEFPDPGDPLTFDVDNTTFATGWYAGGALGIAAEAYVTAGVGSAASAAGKGLPIVGRAIRAGETASAFLARGVGVAKQGALLTGRTVARGTGLARDAVTNALGRLSVASQATIRELTAELGEGTLRSVRDAELDGELIRYLDETGQAGVQTLTRLDDAASVRALLSFRRYRLGQQLADRGVSADEIDLSSFDLRNSYPTRFFGPDNDQLAYPEIRGRFTARFENVEVGLRYVRDGDSFINRYLDDGDRDLPEAQQKGIVGEEAADDIAAAKGYRVLGPDDGFDKAEASDIGIDNIARTDDGEFVLIEAKYTSNNRIGYDLIKTDAYDGNPQLSTQWTLNAIEEMQNRGILTEGFPVEELIRAVENGNVRRELTVIRDAAADGRTLRRPQSLDRSLTDTGIDSVEVVDLPEVTTRLSIADPTSPTTEIGESNQRHEVPHKHESPTRYPAAALSDRSRDLTRDAVYIP